MKQKRFNFKKKSMIISVVIVMLMLMGLTIYSTYSEYKATKNNTILQEDSNKLTNDNVTLAIVVVDEDGNETTLDEFPTEGYVFDHLKSNCENGSIIEFDETSWTASITTTNKDKCTFYFNPIYGSLATSIINNSIFVEETPDFDIVDTEENKNLYKMQDDLGDSYYFRGAPTNNYVKFGEYVKDTTLTIYSSTDGIKSVEIKAGTPMYWRIVRINGDGSIRLIYDGTEKVANGVAHTATIQATQYNTDTTEKKLLGYTYDDGSGNQVDSEIKKVIEAWYENNLESVYGKYIADGIFCNDREEILYYDIEGDVTNAANAHGIEFGPSTRTDEGNPKLTCTQDADKYTESSTRGNGFLSKPVGLITSDEMQLAGGTYAKNSNYYLFSGELYWGISPCGWSLDDNGSMIFGSNLVGGISCHKIDYGRVGIRPVINIKADVKFTGDGSYETPYTIVTN